MLSIGVAAALPSIGVSTIPGVPISLPGAPAHTGIELALRC
jgi:hypothetical protein